MLIVNFTDLVCIEMTRARENINDGAIPENRAIRANVDSNFVVSTARILSEYNVEPNRVVIVRFCHSVHRTAARL